MLQEQKGKGFSLLFLSFFGFWRGILLRFFKKFITGLSKRSSQIGPTVRNLIGPGWTESARPILFNDHRAQWAKLRILFSLCSPLIL